jgi:hypothetical protein
MDEAPEVPRRLPEHSRKMHHQFSRKFPEVFPEVIFREILKTNDNPNTHKTRARARITLRVIGVPGVTSGRHPEVPEAAPKMKPSR